MPPTTALVMDGSAPAKTELPAETFWLHPQNEAVIRGKSGVLKVFNLSKQHLVWELGFRYLGLIIAFVAMVWLEGTGISIVDALVPLGLLIVLAILIPVLVENRVNAYLNRRITDRIHREGQILQGELVACETGRGFEWRFLKFFYRVTTPSGQMVQRNFLERDLYSLRKRVPTPGTPVAVLYFSDDEHYLL
jgi:hypothetical protein